MQKLKCSLRTHEAQRKKLFEVGEWQDELILKLENGLKRHFWCWWGIWLNKTDRKSPHVRVISRMAWTHLKQAWMRKLHPTTHTHWTYEKAIQLIFHIAIIFVYFINIRLTFKKYHFLSCIFISNRCRLDTASWTINANNLELIHEIISCKDGFQITAH